MNRGDKILLTLHEATLTLYPAAADGSPITTSPLWMGACESSLRIAERWSVVNTRPTASKHQRHHPLSPTYEISISRQWVLKYPLLVDFQATRRQYVLDIVWREEDTGDWHRNVFYGVTIRDRSRDSRAPDEAFEDGQTFDAEYFIPTSGMAPTAVPGISSSLPFVIRWRGSEGMLDLYTYDPGTQVFTEISAGAAATRAEIEYVPDRATGELQIIFAGDIDPTLKVDADGMTVPAVLQQVPSDDILPRLEFFYGNRRIATLGQVGLFVFNVNDSGLAAGTGRYQLYHNNVLKSTIALTGLVTDGLTA